MVLICEPGVDVQPSFWKVSDTRRWGEAVQPVSRLGKPRRLTSQTLLKSQEVRGVDTELGNLISTKQGAILLGQP